MTINNLIIKIMFMLPWRTVKSISADNNCDVDLAERSL